MFNLDQIAENMMRQLLGRMNMTPEELKTRLVQGLNDAGSLKAGLGQVVQRQLALEHSIQVQGMMISALCEKLGVTIEDIQNGHERRQLVSSPFVGDGKLNGSGSGH